MGMPSRAMQVFLRSAMVVAAVSLAAAEPPAGPQDPLWQKAVELAARVKAANWRPLKLETTSRVMKKDGTVTDQGVILSRLVYDDDGEGHTETISATRNGKDVTDKVREEERKDASRMDKAKKEERERKQDEPADGMSVTLEPGYHPFDRSVQARMSARRLPDTVLEGRAAALFAFSQVDSKGSSLSEGRAWLDPATGAPLKVEVRPVTLPKHIDAMETIVRFESTPEGLWRATVTEVKGAATFLLFHRRIETEMRLLDWQQARPKAP